MAVYGYARVSTEGQTLEAQVEALRAQGVDRLFQEKISGAKAERPQLQKLLASLEAGDVVVVTRLDRLARSTRDLLNIMDTITKAGAAFRSLADPWADTTSPQGRLLVTVLAGFAEFERTLIAARTTEGRARAKAKGKRMGRPSTLTAHQRAEIIEALRTGAVKPADLARRFNVHRSTIARLADNQAPR